MDMDVEIGDKVTAHEREAGSNAGVFPVTGIQGKLLELGDTKFTRTVGEVGLPSQRDKLGQQVNIGDDLIVSYMMGRSHYFRKAKVQGLTPKFAVLTCGRRVRFYNTVVVNAITRQPQGGVSTAELMAADG